MDAGEYRARLNQCGAGPVDVSYVAGVSLRAVRMALSPTGWSGKPAQLDPRNSLIARALPQIEAGKRAPEWIRYSDLDGANRASGHRVKHRRKDNRMKY